jgi:hypothetical protein
MTDEQRHVFSTRLHQLERHNDYLQQTLWLANEHLGARNRELSEARAEIVRLREVIDAVVSAAAR